LIRKNHHIGVTVALLSCFDFNLVSKDSIATKKRTPQNLQLTLFTEFSASNTSLRLGEGLKLGNFFWQILGSGAFCETSRDRQA